MIIDLSRYQTIIFYERGLILRLMIYITMFFAMFNFVLFADEKEKQEMTLKQAERIANIVVPIYQKAFEVKVAAYSSIDGMNMQQAKSENIWCMAYRKPKVISFVRGAERKPSDNEFEQKLKEYFEENKDKDISTYPDEIAKRLRIAGPLRVNSNCKICHPIYNEGEIAGAMIFDFPLKSDNEAFLLKDKRRSMVSMNNTTNK